jgi:casein kinase I homolog HRR25
MKLPERFERIKKIGSGSFAKVYKAKDLLTGTCVALKVSQLSHQIYLQNEVDILKDILPHKNFPDFKWAGVEESNCMLATTLLGPSLLSHILKNNFSPSEILDYIKQILKALKHLHNKGYIHKDIKPSNMCIGYRDKKSVHLIDFGITEVYMDKTTNKHFPRVKNPKFCGNYPFSSEGALCGISPSRRDDLEALCYVAIYLLKKDLPWLEHADNFQKMMEIRSNCVKKLARNIPEEMVSMLNYCKTLTYDQKPNYKYLSRAIDSSKVKYNSIFYSEVSVRRNKSLKNVKFQKRMTIISSIAPTVRSDLPEFTEKTKIKSKNCQKTKT